MSKDREAYNELSDEEKKQLAILGNNLGQPLSSEDEELQELFDMCVEARKQEALKRK